MGELHAITVWESLKQHYTVQVCLPAAWNQAFQPPPVDLPNQLEEYIAKPNASDLGDLRVGGCRGVRCSEQKEVANEQCRCTLLFQAQQGGTEAIEQRGVRLPHSSTTPCHCSYHCHSPFLIGIKSGL
eukprot:2472905-Amphidinium_carterae.1